MNDPVRIAILGTGGRGAEAYGRWIINNPERGLVVAVAEPLVHRRDAFAERAGVPLGNRFGDWRELLRQTERLEVEAVIIALPDTEHVEPTVFAAEQGLAILLEKPVAPDEASLRMLEKRLEGLRPRIAVAHVLRETPFWRAVHGVVSAGLLGDVATIRLEENIGFWHFAHSYVRGNWRRTASSSPLALAKTSHDLDLIRWLAGATPRTVASVGSLQHFHSGNAPKGAPTHCVKGCPVADTCPFYAPRYYADALAEVDGWPVALLGPDVSPRGRMAALEDGPYGRCVYQCDNDVVDHQQTMFSFASGITATLTVSAFTGANTRTFQITGAHGELSGRMETGELRLEKFTAGAHDLPDLGEPLRVSEHGPLSHAVYEWEVLPPRSDAGDHRGHAGGDDAMSERFVEAVRAPDFNTSVTTSLDVSLDSHWMAFAAEHARATEQVIKMDDIRESTQGWAAPSKLLAHDNYRKA